MPDVSAALYLLRLLDRCPGLHCCWPEVPHAPHLCPHCQNEPECLDLHCDPRKRDLTHMTGEGRTGVSLHSRRNKWTEISLELHVCMCVVFISHFAPVSVSPGVLLMRSSLFCRAAAFFSTAERHKHLWNWSTDCTQSENMWSSLGSICKYSLRVPIPWEIHKPAGVHSRHEAQVWRHTHLLGASASRFSFSSISRAWRCVPGWPACCCGGREEYEPLRPGSPNAAPSAGPSHLQHKTNRAALKKAAGSIIHPELRH